MSRSGRSPKAPPCLGCMFAGGFGWATGGRTETKRPLREETRLTKEPPKSFLMNPEGSGRCPSDLRFEKQKAPHAGGAFLVRHGAEFVTEMNPAERSYSFSSYNCYFSRHCFCRPNPASISSQALACSSVIRVAFVARHFDPAARKLHEGLIFSPLVTLAKPQPSI
jgi:hypothetical protein